MSRALLVSPISPWAASFGAQQRTAYLYRALADLMPVDVLLLAEGREDRAAPGGRPEILSSLSWKQPSLTLGKYGLHAWTDAWCRSNLDWQRYSVVVGRYLTPITKIAWPAHIRTIVDCDDAVYRYVPAWPGPFGRAAAAAQGWLRYRQTKAAIARYDHIFFCSPRDSRMFPVRSSSILPNVVPIRPAADFPDECARNLLIVGSLWYAPNRHGVDWFLERCWPEIAVRCPTLNLRIVGPAPAGVRERWAQAVRTEAPGFVEDLPAEYAGALFAAAPIHYGGGTCIKFLEAAAHARACVATEYVYSAFAAEFRDGYSAVVARNPREVIENSVGLFQNARRRDEISRRAYETAEKLYTIERFTQAVQQAVRRVLPGCG